MIIRDEQVKTLSEVPSRAFEDEMVSHLARFSPPLFNAIKEPQLRLAIRTGIARAAECGITFRGPIRLYLELMLLFGSHFDTDPQYPWATEILRDPAPGPQMQRADLLYRRTRQYRQTVGGPNDEYTLAALHRLPATIGRPLPFSERDFIPGLLQEMSRVYPEKSEYVGEGGLRELIQTGAKTARSCGFTSVRAMALPVVLMFSFGHKCFDDPLYPWIGRTVKNGAVADPAARAARLEKKASTWLNHVLAYFDRGAGA